MRGRVQGVFFREFTRSQALRLGLVGWVRNLPDGGTVEVTAEGPHAALSQLVTRLREGPRGAFVDSVDVDWGSAVAEFRSFDVAP